MNRSLKIAALIVLTVALCHRQTEADAATIHVRNAEIDICFETRTLAVYIDVDPIALSDSLLGYDVSLTFNPDYVRFDRLLTLGTLSDGLEWEAQGNFSRPGVANAQGVNVSRFFRSSERTPLIGFIGRLVGDCPQEIILEVAEASFAKLQPDGVRTIDEQATISGLGSLIAVEGLRPKREVAVRFSSNEDIVFEKGIDKSASVLGTFMRGEETRQSKVDVELEIVPADLFSIEGIKSLEKGIGVSDVLINESGNQASFTCDFSASTEFEVAEFLQIDLRNRLNVDTTAELVLRPIQAESCSCVTELLGSSLILKSQLEITTSVSDRHDQSPSIFDGIRVSHASGEWLIENQNDVEAISQIVIYDLLGHRVYQHRADFGNRWVRVPNSHLSAGTYLAHVTSISGSYIVLNMSK